MDVAELKLAVLDGRLHVNSVPFGSKEAQGRIETEVLAQLSDDDAWRAACAANQLGARLMAIYYDRVSKAVSSGKVSVDVPKEEQHIRKIDPNMWIPQVVYDEKTGRNIPISQEAIEILKKANQVGCKKPIGYVEAQQRVTEAWYKKFWRKFSRA